MSLYRGTCWKTLSTWKKGWGECVFLLPIELAKVRRAESQEGQEPTFAMELTHRGGLSSTQEAWTKEGAVAALDPTSAAPWRPFRFFSPEAAAGEIAFCNFKASCRRSCGGVMELEGK
ncbi:unnamed protein product, partial [Cylindrotheca closterium]